MTKIPAAVPEATADTTGALWTAHREHAARSLARRHRLSVDHPDVQDAISATFVRILRSLQRGGTFDRTAARSWVTAIAHNEYLRIVGATYARRTVAVGDQVDEVVDDAPAPDVAIVDRAAAADVSSAVGQALARLTPVQRDVIGDYARGLTYAEIAQRHGLSPTATNKAIVRAKVNLSKDGRLARAVAERHR